MASNIDPTIIDGQYPIAGKDQPSQGFRTNFTGIEENFSAAASEITELQEKAVLKAPLSGTTLDNNLQGNEILSAKMRDLLIPVAGINWSAGQVNSLDTLSGGYQTVLLNQSRPYAVTFNNFSRTFGKGASYSTVLLQVNNQGNNSIALQSGKNYVGLEKISYANPASKTLNFYSTNPTTVSNVVLSFSSADGNTFLVQDLSRDVSGLNYGVPVNFPQGRSGDKQGDIQVYQGNVYICTQNYTTGGTSIWTVSSGGGGGGSGPSGTGGQVQFAVSTSTGPAFSSNENFVFSTSGQSLFVPFIVANAGIEITDSAPLTMSGDITARDVIVTSVYSQDITAGNLTVLDTTSFNNLNVNTLTSAVNILGLNSTLSGNLRVNNTATLGNASVTNGLTVNGIQYASSGATVPGQVLGVTNTNQLGFFSVPGVTPQSANTTIQFADYSSGIARFNGSTNLTYNFAPGVNLLSTPNLAVSGAATIASSDIGSLRANSAYVGGISNGYFLPSARTSANGWVLTGYIDGTTNWQPTAALYGNTNVADFLANYGSNVITTTGNITGGNIIASNYVYGNGAFLTGISADYSNANVAAYLQTYTGFIYQVNSLTDINVGSVANISADGIIRTNNNIVSPAANITTLTVNEIQAGNSGTITLSDNTDVNGVIDASGNIKTDGYFIGDGSLLSNVPGTTPSGSNGYVQFNNNGAFGSAGTFTFDQSTGLLSVGGNIVSGSTLIGGAAVVDTLVANTLQVGQNNTQFQSVIGNLLIDGSGPNDGVLQVEGNASIVNLLVTGDAVIGNVNNFAESADLTVAGNVSVIGRTNLGLVSNVTITGGSLGQVLSTDGSGGLSWATVSGGGGNGSSVLSVRYFSGNITATSDFTLYAFDGSSNVTVTLPQGNANLVGVVFNVKDTTGILGNTSNISGGSNLAITIQCSGNDLIDGSNTAVINVNYENYQFTFVGSNVWAIL